MSEQAARMQCMEVWGGNERTDAVVTATGLDLWVHSRPHGDATGGGDVYYVSSCASGRITRLLVADVMGHGHAVSDEAVRLRGLMRRYVNYVNQARFVGAMNRDFKDVNSPGGFATAVVATFFLPTRTLTLHNAGHPPPLLFRAAERTWATLGADWVRGRTNVPLGVIGDASFKPVSVRLLPKDLLLCYTDSLIEGESRSGEVLGVDGLLQLVRGLDPSDPGRFQAALLAASADLHGPAGDDLTVLLATPNDQRPSTWDNLAAPYRTLRHVFAPTAGRWR